MNILRPIFASVLASLLLVFALLESGCHTSAHPNQLNAFDGATYDTLTAAHAATAALRAQIATGYPKYTAEFNVLADSENTAISSYAAFRIAPAHDTVAISAALGALTINLMTLENAIQADLHPAPAAVAAVQRKARFVRAHAKDNLSLTDVLTILETAATVAQTIPVASPYAALATVVIQATSEAVSSIEAHSGSPIDLSTLPLIEKLPA